jgi:DNA polymerase-1
MSAPVSTSAPAVPTTTGGRPRLLLLDGHSLAYRAFFALPVENFSTTTGQPTNAVYGFTSMLINILRDEQPTHLAVAFDVGRKTFRSEIFADYKANRSESPTDFRGQVSLVQEVLAALHVPVITADNYEADDVIATLTVQAVEQGMDVLIATGDRDALQLVNDHVTVLYPRKGVSDMTRFTPEEVETKYGLSPAQTSPRSVATRATTSPASRAWGRRPPPSGSASTAPSTPWSTRSTRSRGRWARSCVSICPRCCRTAG